MDARPISGHSGQIVRSSLRSGSTYRVRISSFRTEIWPRLCPSSAGDDGLEETRSAPGERRRPSLEAANRININQINMTTQDNVPPELKPRSLIVCLDGTSEAAYSYRKFEKKSLTNVSRISRLIPAQKEDGTDQIVLYLSGVGTGEGNPLKRVHQAFGKGTFALCPLRPL